jgi:lipopolysaccharide export system protein LptC
MVAAVGTSTLAASTVAGQTGTSRGSRAGLEAQLDTYKKQLNDWVTCASAKTPDGKEKITDLTNKVSSTEARIKDLDNIRGTARAAVDNKAQYINSPSDVKTVETVSTSASVGASSGSLVDTFA